MLSDKIYECIRAVEKYCKERNYGAEVIEFRHVLASKSEYCFPTDWAMITTNSGVYEFHCPLSTPVLTDVAVKKRKKRYIPKKNKILKKKLKARDNTDNICVIKKSRRKRDGRSLVSFSFEVFTISELYSGG